VPKDCLRVRALGTIDELNAHLGMAASMGLTPTLVALLHEIQQDLLNLGSDLAVPGSDPIRLPIPSVDARQVQLLESIIDIARTVCRRAEREVVALARAEGVGEQVLPYLNRLSDALFVMARYENHCRGTESRLWEMPPSR